MFKSKYVLTLVTPTCTHGNRIVIPIQAIHGIDEFEEVWIYIENTLIFQKISIHNYYEYKTQH